MFRILALPSPFYLFHFHFPWDWDMTLSAFDSLFLESLLTFPFLPFFFSLLHSNNTSHKPRRQNNGSKV